MDMNEKLDLILLKLDEHSRILVEHSSILGEHSGILGALIHGQEEIKATLEGFKIEVNEKFGEMTNKA